MIEFVELSRPVSYMLEADRYVANPIDFWTLCRLFHARVDRLAGFELLILEDSQRFIRVYSDPDVPRGKLIPL